MEVVEDFANVFKGQRDVLHRRLLKVCRQVTFVGSELVLALQKHGNADANDEMDTTEEGDGHGVVDADLVEFAQLSTLQKAAEVVRAILVTLRQYPADYQELEMVHLAGTRFVSMCKEIWDLTENATQADEFVLPSFRDAREKGIELAHMFTIVSVDDTRPLVSINLLLHAIHADLMGRRLGRLESQPDATNAQDKIDKLEKMNKAQLGMNTGQEARIAAYEARQETYQAETAALQTQLRAQQDIMALSAQKKVPHASSDAPATTAVKKDVRFANLPKLPVPLSKSSKTPGYMKGTSAADARNRGTDATGQIQRPWTPKAGDRRKKATSPSSPPLQAAKKLKMVVDVEADKAEADKAHAVTMEVGTANLEKAMVNTKVKVESAAKAKAEEAEAAKAAEKAKGGGSVKGSGRGRGRGRGSGGE